MAKDDLTSRFQAAATRLARRDRTGATSNWPSRSAPTGSTSSSTWPATRPTTGCWCSPASRRRSRSRGRATWAPPGWRRWTTSWPTAMKSRRRPRPHYCERVLRMPDGYVCYDPPGYAPPVSPLPALNRGYVTFGCFNNPAKITPQVIEVWARILHRVPQSRLVLKYRGMSDPASRQRLGGDLRRPRDRSQAGWSFSARRPTRNRWRSTTASIWPSIRFPTTAA